MISIVCLGLMVTSCSKSKFNYPMESLYGKWNVTDKIVSQLNLSIIIDIIRLAGVLLGSKDLIKIIKQMYDEDQSPITFCIYLYCSLWYNKQPPINELKDKFNDFPLTIQTIIRLIIKNFFY